MDAGNPSGTSNRTASGWNWPDPAHGTGLYVHIPFCETKCPYCDFNTYSGIERLMPSYMSALRTEIAGWGAALGALSLESIFFGGGTPSYLPLPEISLTLDSIRSAFSLLPHAEVTIESNPGDITAEKLASWLDAGVNRLSLGVQSFDDELLALLGRRHDSSQARNAFALARSVGFDNASLDLMYALPRQSLARWQNTIDDAIALEPAHISLYSLQIEPGTPFEKDVMSGRLETPNDDLAADMYHHAMDRLASTGYRHYEISNWCLPGRESRHNLLYWKNRPYLGVGPGAHSSLHGQRFANLKSPRGYVAKLQGMDWPSGLTDPVAHMRDQGAVDFHEETTRDLAMSETMMMGLRLDDGVADSTFRAMFGLGIAGRYGPVIDELQELGLIEWRDAAVRLTDRGRPLGNEVFARFVVA